MKLIKIQGDVFAARSVTAILTSYDPEEPDTITIRSDGEDYEYNFDSTEDTLRAMAEAVQVLQSLDEPIFN